MATKNISPLIYDNEAGSQIESSVQGAGGLMAASSLFGTSSINGVLVNTQNDDGTFNREINGRAGASAAISVLAGAATGAAAFTQLAGPGGAVAGAAFNMIGTALTGGLAAYDSQKCIAELRRLDGMLDVPNLHWTEDLVTVSMAIEYCIGKQQVKFNKGVSNATGVGQPLVAAYRGGKAVMKWIQGTKGKNRQQISKELVRIAQKNNGIAPEMARQVISAIAAQNFDSFIVDSVANAMKSG
ncbi:hypothetical protein SAMN04490202_0354 [Pseudomonas reinekei]|jgi:hypothetical protein|uniref:Uncharacterized protein n=1 Tax=Pseudomonas reinekei TaxID=395598 RepID=A0A1H0I3F5_PSERE|nr:hypothetical protein [Pseudomonas reinekei]KAB0486899.1 hypothetical protein F7R15_08510 [Pseudomonas reinekei]OLU04107.1 hypothetical protein BVK86_07580 [Pseudomonas reinekei]SDO25984.1 hypothetical protein SAMN04490202_0354 [Pseudomonas reinekei]